MASIYLSAVATSLELEVVSVWERVSIPTPVVIVTSAPNKSKLPS